jgi:hypothetical protein
LKKFSTEDASKTRKGNRKMLFSFGLARRPNFLFRFEHLPRLSIVLILVVVVVHITPAAAAMVDVVVVANFVVIVVVVSSVIAKIWKAKMKLTRL